MSRRLLWNADGIHAGFSESVGVQAACNIVLQVIASGPGVVSSQVVLTNSDLIRSSLRTVKFMV